METRFVDTTVYEQLRATYGTLNPADTETMKGLTKEGQYVAPLKDQKKCIILLALSFFPGRMAEKAPRCNMQTGSSDGKGGPYTGVYQLDVVSQYVINNLKDRDIDKVEFIMLETAGVRERPHKPVTIDYNPRTDDGLDCVISIEGHQPPTEAEFFITQIDQYIRELNKYASRNISMQFVEYYLSDNTATDMPNLLNLVRKEAGYSDKRTGKYQQNAEIYIDIHGGPRSTQQLLVNLLSILSEENIAIDPAHILAVDGQNAPITQSGDSFEINDFVSGIHEFVNYGRMNSFNRFYPDTNELLKKADALTYIKDETNNIDDPLVKVSDKSDGKDEKDKNKEDKAYKVYNEFIRALTAFRNYVKQREDVDNLHRQLAEMTSSILDADASHNIRKSQVDTLKSALKYFNRNDATYSLLIAMKEVSSAIQLCDMAWFEKKLPELAKAITEFNKPSKKRGYLGAFLNLIYDGYSQLILERKPTKEEQEEDPELRICYEAHLDAVKEIEWCRDKGLYQQMLTICESAMPRYLEEKEIITYDGYLEFMADAMKDPYERYNYLFNRTINGVYHSPNRQYYKWQIEERKLDKKVKTNYALQTVASAARLRNVIITHFKLKDLRNHSSHGSLEAQTISIDDLENMINSYLHEVGVLIFQRKNNQGGEGRSYICVTAVDHKKSSITREDVEYFKTISDYISTSNGNQHLRNPETLNNDIPENLRHLYGMLYQAINANGQMARKEAIEEYCSNNGCTTELCIKLLGNGNDNLQACLDALGGDTTNEFRRQLSKKLDERIYKDPELVAEVIGKPYQ